MTRHLRRLPLAASLIAGLVLLWLPPPTTADVAVLEGLDAQVARVLHELHVPGMGVAVVKDGEVVLSRGYGVRRVGEPGPVDGGTLFGIASNSKAFTCAALSILVEEGRLAWDDPVIRHVPELEMYDPWVSREIRVEDLVTHRSGLGLGEGDLMWWPPTDFSREEILRGVRHLKPATSFRTTYAYNNIMFVVAGEVVARVSGRTWGEFLRERILDPLGMTRTTTSAVSLEPGEGVATPHVELEGRAQPIRLMSFENAAGAVGVHSSADEMALWLNMLLDCGREATASGETCVLKPESIQRMWSSKTPKPAPRLPGKLAALEADFMAYGLGFDVQEYKGHKLVSHGGAVPGYLSRVALVPSARLGIALLTNQESRVALYVVTQHVLDAVLGPPGPPVDWLGAFAELKESEARAAEKKVREDAARRDMDSGPSLALSGYAGLYRDPWYGDVDIVEEEDGLVLSMTRTPRMVADLEHWQHDTFVARWRETWMSDHSPYDAYVVFVLGPDGLVDRMTMEPVSPAIDFSFDFQDLLFTPVRDEEARARDE
jgi:CubicO group peptidase (beta-lactamase class C family)